MSTGKRLAKRSIIGTRVCAQGTDGIWYSGIIQEVKTPANTSLRENNNCINLTPNTRYKVRFDIKQDMARRGPIKEFRESELIGPGFRTIMDVSLRQGQKVFLTYNGRESSGEVLNHDVTNDEVNVVITPIGFEVSFNFFLFFNYLKVGQLSLLSISRKDIQILHSLVEMKEKSTKKKG